MVNNGKRIEVPEIITYKHGKRVERVLFPHIRLYHSNDKNPTVFKNIIDARPFVAVKQFVALGFDEGWFGKDFITRFLAFGLERGYWNDFDIHTAGLKFFFADGQINKVESKELDKVKK